MRLETDDSIVRHGFEVDRLEWNGSAICPAVAWPACGTGTIDVSAAFICSMLAVAFLGPAAAFAVAIAAELVSWLLRPTRPIALVVNVAGVGLPNLIAATVFLAIAGDTAEGSTWFIEALALKRSARWIVDDATPGVVQDGGRDGAADRLLYAGDL